MREAAAILEIIRERGKKGLPLERVYRLLFNRELFLTAYGKLYRNDGALTPGSTPETVDEMSIARIDAIIEALRFERYHWTPTRRVYIEKKNSTKKRPLGLPIWVSYCLSFQAMFGIPMVANWVDQKPQSTLLVLLYHILSQLASPATFPVSLSRLAQLRDDVWGEGNPARAMRVSADALQKPCVTPIGDRRDVDIEQFRGCQCGVAPIASLSGWTESWSFRAREGNMVDRTNPVDFASRKAAAEPWTQTFLIEQVRDLGSCMDRSQFAHPSDNLRTGLTDFPRLFEARDGQARARLRLPANVDHDKCIALGKRNIFDQPAQKLFALGKSRRWGLPECRQILCKLADLFPLFSRQHQGGRFRQNLIFPFQPIHLQQFLIPLAFQAPCDQPIVRIYRTVATASQIRLILSPLDLSPHLLIDLFGTRFQLGQGRERNFQPSRLDGFQKTLCDCLIDALPAHGLTGFHRQLGMSLAALVNQQRAVSLIAYRHPAPAGATEHDALQERGTFTHRSPMSGCRGILIVDQLLLMATKLFPGDVAWVPVQQDNGPVFLLHAACSSLDARLFTRQCVPTRLGSSVDVGSGVRRTVQDIQNSTVAEANPLQLPRAGSAPMPGGKAQLMLGKVAHDGQRRVRLLEERENQADRFLNGLIRIKQHPAHRIIDQTARQAKTQLALFSFGQLAALQPLVQPMQFRLTHGPFDYVSSKINTLDQQEDLVETGPLADCLPRFSVTNLHPFREQKFAAGLHKEPVVLSISFNASTHPFTVEPDLQDTS